MNENSARAEPPDSDDTSRSWEPQNEIPQGDGPDQVPFPALNDTRSPENPPWTLVDIVRLVALSVAVLLVTSLLAAGLALTLRGNATPEEFSRDPWVAVPAQLLAYIVIMALMVLMVRSYGRAFWPAVRWNWPVARWVAFVAFGGILALAVQAVSALLPVPESLPIEQYFREPTGAWLMAAFGVSIAPLFEELFFRGFVYPVVARRAGVAAGVLITGATFAAIHGPQLGLAWGPLMLLLVVGVILTAVRAQTLSVAASFLVHVGYNAMLFTLMYISTAGFQDFAPRQ